MHHTKFPTPEDDLLFIYLQMSVHLIRQNTCLWVAHGNDEGVSLGWRELYNTADDDGKQYQCLVTGTRHSPPSQPPDTPLYVPPAWLSPHGIPAVLPTHAQPVINTNHITTDVLIGGGRMKLKRMTYSFHRFDCLSASHDCFFICLPRHLTARNLQLLTSQHTQVCISLHYVCYL